MIKGVKTSGNHATRSDALKKIFNQDLKIQDLKPPSVENKAIAFEDLLKETKLSHADCAVMGDDWPDLQMMSKAGLRVCPAQGHSAVQEFAHYVTSRSGGASAVRELCDLILKAQNYYEELLNQARN